jgi:anti-sigma factor RsiW
MPGCGARISDESLVAYWFDRAAGDDTETLEAHLFACAACSDRMAELVAIGQGVSELARQGRLSGVIPRGVLNRLQRDGVRVRAYTLAPGETVPCAAFPGDDIIATALQADLSGVAAISLSVEGPGAPVRSLDDVPVVPTDGGVIWVLPASVVRDIPSTRLRITMRAVGDTPRLLGEYVLEHSDLERR